MSEMSWKPPNSEKLGFKQLLVRASDTLLKKSPEKLSAQLDTARRARKSVEDTRKSTREYSDQESIDVRGASKTIALGRAMFCEAKILQCFSEAGEDDRKLFQGLKDRVSQVSVVINLVLIKTQGAAFTLPHDSKK